MRRLIETVFPRGLRMWRGLLPCFWVFFPDANARKAGRDGRKSVALGTALVAASLFVLLLASCAGAGITATPEPTSPTTPMPSPTATSTVVGPTSTPTVTPSPTIPPVETPTLNPTPTLTPTPSLAAPTPTGTPPSTPPPTITPIPQPIELFLQVSSIEDNSVLNSSVLSVAGRSSPDATVSVNGQLAVVKPSGDFATARPLTMEEGPNLIEVIASDLTGEVRTLVLTVIYIP